MKTKHLTLYWLSGTGVWLAWYEFGISTPFTDYSSAQGAQVKSVQKNCTKTVSTKKTRTFREETVSLKHSRMK